MHGGDLLTLRRKVRRSAFKRRVMRAVLGGAAVFVANSRWTAATCRALLDELGLPPAARSACGWCRSAPTRCIGVAMPPAGEAFRRQRGLPSGRWLLTVARLVPYKGIDTAIDVLATLAAAHPALHYAVIGQR